MSLSDSSGYFPAMRTSALGKLEPQGLPAEGVDRYHKLQTASTAAKSGNDRVVTSHF